MNESASNPSQSVVSTGQVLVAWLAIAIVLQGLDWLNGDRGQYLAVAVDRGAARTERNLRGEISDQDALEAIQLQSDSISFWAVLSLLNDVVLEPLWIVFRPLLAAIVVAAAAAMTGKEPPFSRALRSFSILQILWLVGPLLAVFLTEIRREPSDASLRLLLPPGEYPGAAWVTLGKLDLIGMCGWIAMCWTTWRHHLARIWLVAPGFFALAMLELTLRSTIELMLEAGMRLTIIPAAG